MVAAIRAHFVNVSFDTVRLLVPDSIIAPESPQALLAVHGAFMSRILDCDPSHGFVAFPIALFDLDLTPGAFRTLAELCRMANSSGQCWPSLAQLGRRLGRSRASVSAYISELREAGVLSTQEQRMANGYNYRLRYTVTFWKAWRAELGKGQSKRPPAAPAKGTERRVQPAERPLKTKNHIHINQLGLEKSKDLVTQWAVTVGKSPYPSFEQWPSAKLLSATEAKIKEARPSPPFISTDITDALVAFSSERGLTGDVEAVAHAIIPQITSTASLSGLMTALEAAWQHHWKNIPNLYQITRILKQLPSTQDPASTQKLLKTYMQRWKLHLRSLPSSAIRSKVAA